MVGALFGLLEGQQAEEGDYQAYLDAKYLGVELLSAGLRATDNGEREFGA